MKDLREQFAANEERVKDQVRGGETSQCLMIFFFFSLGDSWLASIVLRDRDED